MASFKDLFVNGVARFIGKVYASGGVVGNLEGTATKATQDGSGNTITSTYMTKSNPKGSGTLRVTGKAYALCNSDFTGGTELGLNSCTNDYFTPIEIGVKLPTTSTSNLGADLVNNPTSNAMLNSLKSAWGDQAFDAFIVAPINDLYEHTYDGTTINISLPSFESNANAYAGKRDDGRYIIYYIYAERTAANYGSSLVIVGVYDKQQGTHVPSIEQGGIVYSPKLVLGNIYATVACTGMGGKSEPGAANPGGYAVGTTIISSNSREGGKVITGRYSGNAINMYTYLSMVATQKNSMTRTYSIGTSFGCNSNSGSLGYTYYGYRWCYVIINSAISYNHF